MVLKVNKEEGGIVIEREGSSGIEEIKGQQSKSNRSSQRHMSGPLGVENVRSRQKGVKKKKPGDRTVRKEGKDKRRRRKGGLRDCWGEKEKNLAYSIRS